jgi:hypothetical protein
MAMYGCYGLEFVFVGFCPCVALRLLCLVWFVIVAGASLYFVRVIWTIVLVGYR